MEELRQRMVAWVRDNVENSEILEDENIPIQDLIEIIFLESSSLIIFGSCSVRLEICFGEVVSTGSFNFYYEENVYHTIFRQKRIIATGSLLEGKIIFHLHLEELGRMIKNFSEAGFQCVDCRGKTIGQKEEGV